MPEFDVSGYLSGDPLVLHGVPGEKYPAGKTYTVEPPCAEDELRMRRIVQLQGKQDDKKPDPKISQQIADEIDALLKSGGGSPSFEEKLLGKSVHDEMMADGVTPTVATKLARLVLTNYGVNEAMARLVVETAVGEARARANRDAEQSAAKSTSSKPRASKPRAGSKSSTASGAARTRSTPTSTPRSATSASTRKPPSKTA